MSANNSLLSYLLQRGDTIFIAGGRLVIKPNSGASVPNNWLEEHSPDLIREILSKTNTEAFTYESYSTGQYGSNRYSGVTLQFTSLLSGNEAFAIFNADLKRLKITSKGKKGAPLPKGQFRVGKKSAFYKFWAKTDLNIPPRLSSFHDYMGNLKQLLFSGKYVDRERLDKHSLIPQEVSYSDILKAFNLSVQPDKAQTNSIQHPDKCHTTLPYKESEEAHAPQRIQPNLTTGDLNCGIRLKGSAVTREKVIPINTHKRPDEQTTDEWLADYSR